MNKIYKEAYEAPTMESIELTQSMDVLIGFSFDGDIEDPDYDTDWGNTNNWDWGAAGGLPTTPQG